VSEHGPQNPPIGEEIHLPGPTYIPLVSAIGITCMVIGTTINWLITIVGAIIFLVSTVKWIRDTHHDISELPEEHGH
jgi:hypothetical protein